MGVGDIPRLRFNEHRIEAIAARYQYPIAETELINLSPVVRKQGFKKG